MSRVAGHPARWSAGQSHDGSTSPARAFRPTSHREDVRIALAETLLTCSCPIVLAPCVFCSLAVACLADVADASILGRNADGVLAALRTPEPGLLYAFHLDRLAWVDEAVARHGLRRALSAADLEAAHREGQPAIVGDVEGLDFLAMKLERLEEAHQPGVRHVQRHYTPNAW